MSRCKVATTAQRLGLHEADLCILLHALGIEKRPSWSVGGWRNYYCTRPDCDSYAQCRALELGGWMIGRRHEGGSGDWVFSVTDAGIAALRLAGWKIKEERSD